MSIGKSSNDLEPDHPIVAPKKVLPILTGLKRVSLQSVRDSLQDSALSISMSPTKAEKQEPEGNSWPFIQDRLLQAFSGLGYKLMIEELNVLVKKWVDKGTVESISTDLNVFFKTGMIILANKLNAVQMEVLPTRLADLWTYFYSNVIPYVQGALIPLRNSPKMQYNGIYGPEKTTEQAPLLQQSQPQRKSYSNPRFYSVEIPGSTKQGEGPARRNVNFTGQLVETVSDAHNLHENFLRGLQKSGYGEGQYLGHRSRVSREVGPYVWETYNQIYARIQSFGTGLTKVGATFGTNIGLFSINRTEWVIAEHACYMYGLVSIPLYDTLGTEAIIHIMNLTETSIVAATSDKAKTLLDLSANLSHLKYIIVMDSVTKALVEQARAADITVFSFREIEAQGESSKLPYAETNSDTIATICFTSGTTGAPKGVVLSHGNILSFVGAVEALVSKDLFPNFSKDDVHISYLPLAHIFERLMQAYMTYHGGKIGFYQGDTNKLLDDVAELKPTIFASVPRLYNKIYDKVQAGIKEKGGLAEKLYHYAFNSKLEGLKHGKLTHPLWDRLIFKKIREKLGGRVKFMISAAAPISPEVMSFLRICFSAVLIEGYGQTETTGATCLSVVGDLSTGNVGVPTPNCAVKLVDVPDMNYTSADQPFPRGEVCVKGNSVFKGYYKLEDKTAETISEDGWCHTGDIGAWDEYGRLKIIDRVKNIFKLAQGEYVAPEKIEILYQQHEIVAQAFVYGNSLESVLVGILVIDEQPFKRFCNEHGFSNSSLHEAIRNPTILTAVQKTLEGFGKSKGLKGFENVKNWHLTTEPFSVENNLLTPTFKLKRHDAKLKYQNEIDELYSQLGSQ
ncbi:Long chain acyl-CoA synthetase 7 peroxisomal [Terramyces sp. JEL0728]|nr:Long chain acyl-CoA synthetase 7 peroxisomal [Terramyces sp. JEL0728]